MNQELVKFIFFFLIGTSVINFCIAIAARLKTQHKEFNDLIFYWAWLIVTFIAAALLSHNPTQIGFAYFFQIISSNLIAKMLCSSMDLPFSWKHYLKLQSVGFLLGTYLLVFTDVGFTISMLPVSFVLCIPLFRPVWYSLVTNRHKSNWIEKSMGVIFLTGMVHHFNYAIFRLDPNAAYWGWAISIAQYQCLSILLPLVINLRRETKERSNIESAIQKISGSNANNFLKTDELYRQLELQISLKEKLTSQLKISNYNLEEEREMNEILIKTVSHDLANPLTVVSAYANMLHSRRLPEKDQERTWERIFQNIDSALNMITRIREAIMTKSQANLIKIQDVNIDKVLRRLENAFETQLNAKNLKLIINNRLSNVTLVAAEENALTDHILSNILSNAIKFSYDGGEIYINMTETNSKVKIAIQDFGVGIQKSRLNNTTLHSTLGTNGESGTGFGLMVMGYFTRKFEANLSIDSNNSTSDHGTTVTLELSKCGFYHPLPSRPESANFLV